MTTFIHSLVGAMIVGNVKKGIGELIGDEWLAAEAHELYPGRQG